MKKNIPRLMPVSVAVLALLVSCTPPGMYRDSWRHGWMFGGPNGNRIVETAKRYLGVSYKHGGENPKGFDCSGFVMYVYRKNGISLPRTTMEQFHAGRKISLRNAGPGDLVFFNISGSRRLSHVGIYLGNHRFIHAPRTGKTVSYADMNLQYWKKRYVGTVTFVNRYRDRERSKGGYYVKSAEMEYCH